MSVVYVFFGVLFDAADWCRRQWRKLRRVEPDAEKAER